MRWFTPPSPVLLLLPPPQRAIQFVNALVTLCGWNRIKAHWLCLNLLAIDGYGDRITYICRELKTDHATAAAWLEAFLPNLGANETMPSQGHGVLEKRPGGRDDPRFKRVKWL